MRSMVYGNLPALVRAGTAGLFRRFRPSTRIEIPTDPSYAYATIFAYGVLLTFFVLAFLGFVTAVGAIGFGIWQLHHVWR